MVEDVAALFIENPGQIEEVLDSGMIPIIIDPYLEYTDLLKPVVLVDCTLQKRNDCINKNLASLVIGLGPGFEAGRDVDVVIETHRGHDLGKIIYKGRALEDTKIPAPIMGYGIERLVKSPIEGVVNRTLPIGSLVSEGDVLCFVDNVEVAAPISGVLRGMISSGVKVQKGMKIGDVDPRSIEGYCYTISDKGRAVAGSVLEAVCNFLSQQLKPIKNSKDDDNYDY